MTEPANESGFGSFLKGERERKGLSLEHLSKATRLRIQYLEALEKEEWGRLPSLVFVKGFIKTYTKALGLDYREVLAQFQSSIPAHDDLPRPLVPPREIYIKKYAIAFVIFIIAVSLLVIFSITDPLSHFKNTGDSSDKIIEATPEKNQVDHGEARQAQTLSRDISGGILSPETGSGTTINSETAADETKVASSGFDAAPQSSPALKAARETTAKPTRIPVQGLDLKPVTGVKEKYVLTGYISKKTYIKIYIDNEPPMENIFIPGSYPQWRGNKGFYVLVGNAGGIEFDLNGKRIKDLGRDGEVVRLRLPESFDININE